MSNDKQTVRNSIDTHESMSKRVRKAEAAKGKTNECELLIMSLLAKCSLLQLSVGRLYAEVVLRIIRHQSCDVTYFNDTFPTLDIMQGASQMHGVGPRRHLKQLQDYEQGKKKTA